MQKVFIAKYEGARREEQCYVVVAETNRIALGLALMEVPKSSADEWDMEEIPLDNAGIHWVS